MKAFYYIALAFALSLTSCTEIIDIDLPTAEPRLVVEGNLDFNADNAVDSVYVKLSLTTDYFNLSIPPVNNALVWVEDKQGTKYLFQEHSQTGIYYSTELQKPSTGDSFKLHVEYDNDVYEATETFVSSPEIAEIEQTREKFFDKDYYVVRVYFHDEPQTNQKLNYYYFFYQWNQAKPNPRVMNNEYSKGNRMESLYITDEDAVPGDQVRIEMGKISRNYYDFALSFFDAIDNGGGPFQVPSGRIVGNIKNLTTPEKEAHGYFRVIEKRTTTHTIFEQPKS